jgi:SAM-dependent methyltransferase
MQNVSIHSVLRSDFPRAAMRWMRKRWQRVTQWPAVGTVRFGSLRRVTPISRRFGLDRGQPIDRYYIAAFLSRNADDIRGDVLEIGDDFYTREFGGGRVSRSDVLHLHSGNPSATLVGDLADAQHIESASFDCVIFTQTLQFIYDLRAALDHLHRILKPGGRLLATVPGISQISRYDMDRWGDFWRFTSLSARRLFEDTFPGANVTVQPYGNVLAAIAFLEGLAAEELKQAELDRRDLDYELLISVRAVKPADAA